MEQLGYKYWQRGLTEDNIFSSGRSFTFRTILTRNGSKVTGVIFGPCQGLTLREVRAVFGLSMVSIIHAPPQEIVVTGLTSFTSQQNLASMIAFVMNVSGQPMALYWAEGVVFLADFVEPEALPDEYVKGKIYASNVSHAPMAKYNNLIRVGNMEVPVIDVSSNIALRDLAQWIRENHQSASEKS